MTATFGDLLLLCLAIAFGFLVAVAFYESLSTRDVLVGGSMKLARRLSSRRWVHALAYLLTVGVGIPLLVLLWTIVLELALIVVGSVDRLGSVALVAVAVVGAARILAYVRERTSHELAKAIPLALAFALLTGGATHIDDNIARILEDPRYSELTTAMVAFLLALELGLRLATDSSHAALASMRRRRGIPDHVGFWRSLVAVARPRVSPGRLPEQQADAPATR